MAPGCISKGDWGTMVICSGCRRQCEGDGWAMMQGPPVTGAMMRMKEVVKAFVTKNQMYHVQ